MRRHAITSPTGSAFRKGKTPTRLLPLALALLLIAAVLPPAAMARTTRAYESSFGSFPERPPGALAVDQANGDVYATIPAVGSGSKVVRFTEAGTPKDFTAGPDAGTNTLTGFQQIGAVAIDRSGGPLDGSLWAPDGGDDLIKVFANDGTSLGALDGSGTPQGSFKGKGVCAVAVDQSNGDVYVGQELGMVWRYSPKSPSGTIDDADFTVTGTTSYRSCGLAADKGNVYAVSEYAGGKRGLSKYTTAAFVANPPANDLGTVIDEGPVTAVYVDPKNGDVYADEGWRIGVYDSSGARLYDFGIPAEFGSESGGIAVKSAALGSAAKAYVADRHDGGREIDVFGPLANVPVLTHPEVASFGKDGSAGTSFGAGIGQLTFDQGARKLFALARAVPGIYGFDASSPPVYQALGGFAPLATADTGQSPGLAVDDSGLGSDGNVYFASQATHLLYGFDSSAAPLGGAFPVDPASAPGAPEGSPKELCGTAVDSAGGVWVSNFATKRILKYSSAGTSLPDSIDTSAQGYPCRLAFDSNDNLYALVAGKAGGQDSSTGSNKGIYRYSAASGYTAATLIDSSGVGGIAVDPSNDHLYVANHSFTDEFQYVDWIDEYDSAGAFVDEFAAVAHDTRFDGFGGFGGIAVDATNHYVYVSDTTVGKIRVFGPGVILPEVAIGSASAVANTTATLNGSVGSQAVALDDCHFEYVSEAAFGKAGFADLSSGGSVPCSPAAGSIPLDFTTHPVSASISGLTASTSYRFRLVAANASASQSSADAAFTTPGSAIVETVGAPIRTTSTAQLGGRVDPRNEAATYHFEYGDQGPCDANPCAQTPSRSAGSGDLIQLVSEEVTGLVPGTTYHYRVVADNGNPDGTVFGKDVAVTTPASEAPLSHGHFPGPPGSDRAWEQVTPPDTGGNPVAEALGFSVDGNRALYTIAGGTPLSDTGNLFSVFYSQRTPTGWAPKSIMPPRGEAPGVPHWKIFPDRSLSTMLAGNRDEVSAGSEIWRLDPDGTPSEIFKGAEAAYQLGNLGVSEDGSRLMAFLGDTQDPEHPATAETMNLYDLSSGSPKLVSLMPDGSVSPCGVVANTEGGFPKWKHTISADGPLAFFEGNAPCSRRVYLRDLDAGQTKLITPPPISGLDCESVFIASTPDAAFLWTKSRLVAEDTVPSSCDVNGLDGDVYRYDIGDETLECVTCVVSGQDADVFAPLVFGHAAAERSILVAEDGSRVYFQSPRALLRGAPAVADGGSTYRVNVDTGELAWVGGPGIALGRGDVSNGGGTALTPDGTVLAFKSAAAFLNPLNGADNGGTTQFYRYDDRDRSLICVSCPSNGAAPRGAAEMASGDRIQGVTSMSDGGDDLAFVTPTALVSSDQNTAPSGESAERGNDVYEWRDGRLLLVTDGLTDTTPLTGGPQVAGFSASGRDLYFIAPVQYTPDALDGYRRLYDARIGGGFIYPKPPPPCPLEVCQGTPKGAPEEQAPGTGTFAGTGNAKKTPTRCAKGKARRNGRCVAKKPKKSAHKRANRNRGTAR